MLCVHVNNNNNNNIEKCKEFFCGVSLAMEMIYKVCLQSFIPKLSIYLEKINVFNIVITM